MRIHALGIVALLSGVCAAGLGQIGLGQEGTKADIRGTVTKVFPLAAAGTETIGSILVEGKKEKTTQQDKASVTITKKTRIEKLDNGQRKPATMKDLKVGVRVQVNFVGPVAESYPVQARAGDVLILPATKSSP